MKALEKIKKILKKKGKLKECEEELRYIEKQNLADYFYYMWKHKKRVENTSGSLVASYLGVARVVKRKLRLIPDYVSLPDIDCDFADRDFIANYIINKYGADKACNIGGYQVIKLKGAIKAVAHIDGIPFNKINPVTRVMNEDDTITSACMREGVVADWYKDEENQKWLHQKVLPLVGHVSATTKHPAGMIVAREPITNYLPLKVQDFKNESEKTDERKRVVVTQWSDKYCEERGLLKLDNLGLRTLKILSDLVNVVKKRHKKTIDLRKITTDSKKIFKQFKKQNIYGIFQWETAPGLRICKMLKPEVFDDLIAGISIVRPGTVAGGEDVTFCRRRRGKEDVSYPHPSLEPVLKNTYGIFVYQEQVMQAAHVLGRLTLIESDKFRKAIKAKDPKLINPYRKSFVKGAIKNGMKDKSANEVFELLLHFGGYGFNKNHACAYALYGYWLMYFKVKYPHEFFLTLFKNPKNKDTLVEIRNDAKKNNVDVRLPHVNKSKEDFRIVDTKKKIYIVWGFDGLKGLGPKAVEPLLAGQPYKGLEDFKERGGKGFNKTVVEALTFSGALESWGDKKELLLEFADLQYGKYKRDGGVRKSYEDVVEGTPGKTGYAELSKIDFYNHQTRVLGFCPDSIKEHFIDDLADFKPMSYAKYLEANIYDYVTIAGILKRVHSRGYGKSGERMAFLTIVDGEEEYNCIAWGDYLSRTTKKSKKTYEELIEKALNKIVVVFGIKNPERKDDSKSIIFLSTTKRRRGGEEEKTGCYLRVISK